MQWWLDHDTIMFLQAVFLKGNSFFLPSGNMSSPLPLPPHPTIETVNRKNLGTVSLCDIVFYARVLFLRQICQSPLLQCTNTAVCFLLRPVSSGSSGDFYGTMLYFTIDTYISPFFQFFMDLSVVVCQGVLILSDLTFRFNFPIQHLNSKLFSHL